ncbi:SDR family oxidoreductase [Lysinibacillus agricola]|uniref:SDR family oxidoreductase n=1 Tax=Lysinibacillus agricola TaxID=2590012 RepID=A0ABX7AML8_9BACI|nr:MULTISPECIES: SDR family oxidoreductase [Lysinibacillus]KOS64687.1 alcohol dehydrogenase [Lysinibacillus sp. FJAT-14222]QQP10487.1 SDR family oxidoreductase [Lysinibacillus agricola]
MSKNIVVITGAGSGLGAALAKKYSGLGYYVCLLGRTKSKLEKTAKTLTHGYSIYEVDVSSKQMVAQIIQSIQGEFGSIQLLINNAGVGYFDYAENLSEDSVQQMIDINLKGTIFCTQEVLKGMKERNEGTIVNIVSTAGKEGKVTESVYCASKFGVKGFTESLALELNDTSINVCAVYMGGMRTEFWDGIFSEEQTKNLMDPNDIADIIMDNIKPRKALAVTEVVIKNHR